MSVTTVGKPTFLQSQLESGSPTRVVAAGAATTALATGMGLLYRRAYGKGNGLVIGGMMGLGMAAGLTSAVVTGDSKYGAIGSGIALLTTMAAGVALTRVAFPKTSWANTIKNGVVGGAFLGTGAAAAGALSAQYIAGIPSSYVRPTRN